MTQLNTLDPCWCGARPGEFCKTKSGGKAKKPHTGVKPGPPVRVVKAEVSRPTLREPQSITPLTPPSLKKVEEVKFLPDPDRYRRATFNFALSCKEVVESQKHIGNAGVAPTALVDLKHGLELVSQFINPVVRGYTSSRGYSPFNDD